MAWSFANEADGGPWREKESEGTFRLLTSPFNFIVALTIFPLRRRLAVTP